MFTGTYFYTNENLVKIEGYESPKGTVVYEVIRLKEGKPLFWEEHFYRLQNSLKLLHIKNSLDEVDLKKRISNLVKSNQLANSNLRINVVYDKIKCEFLQVEMGQVPLIMPDKVLYETGVKSSVLAIERPNPNIKNILLELRKKVTKTIEERNVWDVVLKNHHGELTEGGRTNLFFIQNNTIITAPEKQVLPGITRQIVISICEELKIPIEEKIIKELDLETFESAFFTGTSPGIIAIQKIDDYVFDVSSSILLNISAKYKSRVERDISEFG